MSEFAFGIDLPVRTEWANVDLIRTSVQNGVAAMFRGDEDAEVLAMIASELLENSIKYGHWRKPDSTFRLRVWGDEREASVSVENPALPEQASQLEEVIGWIRGFSSSEDAYRSRLIEIATRARRRGPSRLGLVRIAYEGSCDLRVEQEGATVRVIAQRLRGQSPAQAA